MNSEVSIKPMSLKKYTPVGRVSVARKVDRGNRGEVVINSDLA